MTDRDPRLRGKAATLLTDKDLKPCSPPITVLHCPQQNQFFIPPPFNTCYGQNYDQVHNYNIPLSPANVPPPCYSSVPAPQTSSLYNPPTVMPNFVVPNQVPTPYPNFDFFPSKPPPTVNNQFQNPTNYDHSMPQEIDTMKAPQHYVQANAASSSRKEIMEQDKNKQMRSKSPDSLSPEPSHQKKSYSRDDRRDRRSRSRSCDRSSSTSSRRSRRSRSRSYDRRSSRYGSDHRRRSRSRSTERWHRSHRSRSKERSHRSYRSISKERSHRSDSRSSQRRSRSNSSSRDSNRFRSRFNRSPDHRRSSTRSSRDYRSPSYRSRESDLFRKSSSSSNSKEEVSNNLRRDTCTTEDDFLKKIEKYSVIHPEENLGKEENYWIRSAPATLYYNRDKDDANLMHGSARTAEICEKFQNKLIDKAKEVRRQQADKIPSVPAWRKLKRHNCKCAHNADSSSSDDDGDEEDDIGSEESQIMEELQLKIQHPFRLHRELWHNESGEMNDGPLCKCSIKARRSGIRHGIYVGESTYNWNCDPNTNNSDKLRHYRISIAPHTNFLSKMPTIINHDEHEFIFEGFSLLSHYPLPQLPVCKVIRFNIEYKIVYMEESFPENFTIKECDIFFEYLFREVLELLDLDLYTNDGKCAMFHFMPRFVRALPEEGHELLPMCMVLRYLLSSYQPLVPPDLLPDIPKISKEDWLTFADPVKGMVVTKPGMKPSSLRLDHLDKDVRDDEAEKIVKKGEDDAPSEQRSDASEKKSENTSEVPASTIPKVVHPIIIHFGVRPPQLSYAGNQDYQKAWREYVKHRHLVANLAKPSQDDKLRLKQKEINLHQMRSKSNMKRDVTATVSSEGFYRTGLMCDIVQHAMLIPVLACHLRFHRSLDILENRIGYKFKNRNLLQLALTHPSYRENFGTNPDHARNSLTNCGIRQPEFGDRRIHYMRSKKRGISTLISIMSRLGSNEEEESRIYHNERLEFLGDAVVEFAATIHLFFMFKDLEEGGLATYRAALVQNQYLAVLSKNLELDSFLLFAHGSDLCHDLELKHALANCFEALMGALFLDGGVKEADRVFGETAFSDSLELLKAWQSNLQHPLQVQEPDGDRHWIDKIDYLKKLVSFEDSIGVQFRHIRLLARAFTDRSVGYTNLTLGSNQRLEFLGDSVLQLVASEYLYRHFPDHHEGHLSLLRSSLVNNKTQSVVCDDLAMTSYARYSSSKNDLKVKDKADLLEAFLGALYVDKQDLEWIIRFCDVCFFPRLRDFIMNQDWNDPKSKLQQCCLTLRTMNGGEPDIPHYRVIECKGPTNTRTYTVAVYFRDKRLATASGHSIQQAEMNAAQKALDNCTSLFPQLDQQKMVMGKNRKKSKIISPRDKQKSDNSGEGSDDSDRGSHSMASS